VDAVKRLPPLQASHRFGKTEAMAMFFGIMIGIVLGSALVLFGLAMAPP